MSLMRSRRVWISVVALVLVCAVLLGFGLASYVAGGQLTKTEIAVPSAPQDTPTDTETPVVIETPTDTEIPLSTDTPTTEPTNTFTPTSTNTFTLTPTSTNTHTKN